MASLASSRIVIDPCGRERWVPPRFLTSRGVSRKLWRRSCNAPWLRQQQRLYERWAKSRSSPGMPVSRHWHRQIAGLLYLARRRRQLDAAEQLPLSTLATRVVSRVKSSASSINCSATEEGSMLHPLRAWQRVIRRHGCAVVRHHARLKRKRPGNRGAPNIPAKS
jgi:hypothetical protein